MCDGAPLTPTHTLTKIESTQKSKKEKKKKLVPKKKPSPRGKKVC
jgi:hypothetical protein